MKRRTIVTGSMAVLAIGFFAFFAQPAGANYSSSGSGTVHITVEIPQQAPVIPPALVQVQQPAPETPPSIPEPLLEAPEPEVPPVIAEPEVPQLLPELPEQEEIHEDPDSTEE